MLIIGMTLPILAVAFGIYIVGIAFVLYLRPHIMFKPSGSWKEFGIGRGETHTVLPFWLFVVFWAFISYGVALVILSQFANLALNSFQPIPVQNPGPQMYQMPAPAPAPAPAVTQQSNGFLKPVSSMLGLERNVPGYYVLAQNAQSGNPQYIYYGTTPPNLGKY
jgi:hypothetical protein